MTLMDRWHIVVIVEISHDFSINLPLHRCTVISFSTRLQVVNDEAADSDWTGSSWYVRTTYIHNLI